MGFSKEIALGKIGKLVLSEDAGVASLAISAQEVVGAGAVKDIATVNAVVNVQVSAAELIGLLFELVESKSSPGMVLIEKEVQAAVVALLSK